MTSDSKSLYEKLRTMFAAGSSWAKAIVDEDPEFARHFESIATLISELFDGDESAIALWFETPNHRLAGATPRSTLLSGHYERLRSSLEESLETKQRSPLKLVGS